MEALLPSPAPIGIVERRVYKQPEKDGDPRDKRRYKNDEAEL
jgi:hypothetical protein